MDVAAGVMTLVGVALGGGIGFAGSERAGRRSAKAARELEAERREQQRKEDTYLALLSEVSRAHQVIDMEGGVPVELALAGGVTAATSSLNARLLAFGSDQVAEVAREWLHDAAWFTHVQRDLLTLNNRPQGARNTAWSQQVAERTERLGDARTKAQASSKGLITQVRLEFAPTAQRRQAGG